MDVHNLVQVLQGAVGPLFLISGAGLLPLSMTNRLARPIDRIRQLPGELPGAPAEQRPFIEGRIEIFARRCRWSRGRIAEGQDGGSHSPSSMSLGWRTHGSADSQTSLKCASMLAFQPLPAKLA
jgi:hypothetical protein